MGRVSTRDKEEAKKTGKIYLDERFFSYMGKMKSAIRRCDNCGVVLNIIDRNYKRKYCFECQSIKLGIIK